MDSQVTVRKSDAIARPESFEGLMQMAKVLVESKFLPEAIDTPAKAAAIMVAGREIGLTGMQSFRELYSVKGQIGMSTRLIAALFKQRGGRYVFLERNPDKCTVRLTLADGSEHDYSLTRAEADKAGYSQDAKGIKFNWKANPTGMLSNNCLKGGIRLYDPESTLGVLGAFRPDAEPERVDVIVDGEVVEGEAHGYDPDEFDPNDPDHQAAAEASGKSDNGNGQSTGKPHWSSDAAKLQEFIDKAAEYFGLSVNSIKEAMGAPENYATMADAKGAINHWVTEQMKAGKVAS